MAKVEKKRNATNPGKREAYEGALLGHSKGAPEVDKANFSGVDSRVTSHETTGPNVGATVHSQHRSGEGASPNRVRFSEPTLIKENGSTHIAHVTNIPKKESSQTKADAEADKVKLFSRPSSGNSAAVPHREMSPRDWNSTGAPATNTEKA